MIQSQIFEFSFFFPFSLIQGSGDDLEKALNVALETGYRLIDTATVYENEHIIGKVLNEWFSSGKLKREDIFITTKVCTFNLCF